MGDAKKEDKISIIIPVFNIEKVILRCVESVAKQTYRNIEIILVDDGSLDSSGKKCDEIAKKYNNIKVIHKLNGGLSDARNKGIDAAKGKYIFFLDGDDWIDRNTIEKLYNLIKEYDAEIAMTTGCPFRESKEDDNEKEDKIEILKEREILIKLILNKNRWEAWGKLFKSSLFLNRRFKRGILYEDLQLIPKILYDVKTVVVNDNGMYHYYLRETSIMRKSPVTKYIVELAEENIDYFSNDEEVKNLFIEAHFKHLCYWYLNQIIYNGKDNEEFEKEFKCFHHKYVKQYFWCLAKTRNERLEAISFFIPKQIHRLLRWGLRKWKCRMNVDGFVAN